MEAVTVRWLIRGRVQGVGYRYFTREAASALGLRGTVRNRSDGTVEVDVCGPPETVNALRVRLLEGPRWSEVLAIDDSETPDSPLPERFEVRF